VRLSSKSHWDVPVTVGRKTVHLLASHPTPPVFDGREDRNGKRNNDEIRLWADYIEGGKSAAYLYDDQAGVGGLDRGERFVILGDQNSDRSTAAPYRDPSISSLSTASSRIPSVGRGRCRGVGPPGRCECRTTAASPSTTPPDLKTISRQPAGRLRASLKEPARSWRRGFLAAGGNSRIGADGESPVPLSDHRLVYAT
jgi:hypothetical protein